MRNNLNKTSKLLKRARRVFPPKVIEVATSRLTHISAREGGIYPADLLALMLYFTDAAIKHLWEKYPDKHGVIRPLLRYFALARCMNKLEHQFEVLNYALIKARDAGVILGNGYLIRIIRSMSVLLNLGWCDTEVELYISGMLNEISFGVTENDYEQRLGKGNCAVVNRANLDALGGVTVAVKNVRPDIEKVLIGYEQYKLTYYANPYLVSTFTFFRCDNGFAMPIVGCDLYTLTDRYARRRQWLMPTEIYSIVWQIALGLKSLHAQHLVYVDLKLENVAVSRSLDGFSVKLIDVGHAVPVGDVGPTDFPLGTVVYSPPESLRRAPRDFDGRVDMWALGLIVWCLMTLRVPYDHIQENAIALYISRGGQVTFEGLSQPIVRFLQQQLLTIWQQRKTSAQLSCYLANHPNLFDNYRVPVAAQDCEVVDAVREPLPKPLSGQAGKLRT